MTTTTNYGLSKPDLTDNAKISVINGNMDVIDAALFSVNNQLIDMDDNGSKVSQATQNTLMDLLLFLKYNSIASPSALQMYVDKLNALTGWTLVDVAPYSGNLIYNKNGTTIQSLSPNINVSNGTAAITYAFRAINGGVLKTVGTPVYYTGSGSAVATITVRIYKATFDGVSAFTPTALLKTTTIPSATYSTTVSTPTVTDLGVDLEVGCYYLVGFATGSSTVLASQNCGTAFPIATYLDAGTRAYPIATSAPTIGTAYPVINTSWIGPLVATIVQGTKSSGSVLSPSIDMGVSTTEVILMTEIETTSGISFEINGVSMDFVEQQSAKSIIGSVTCALAKYKATIPSANAVILNMLFSGTTSNTVYDICIVAL